jgi:ParB family chromosome partitioning protein
MVEKMLEEVAAAQEPPKKSRIKGKMHYNIYINTIKNACREMVRTGCQVEYAQVDKGPFIEVTVKIPKNV